MNEDVNHPDHYNMLPNGIECIDVIQHFNLTIGNAIKYLWRCRHKNNLITDLKKAKWYIEYEIDRVCEFLSAHKCPYCNQDLTPIKLNYLCPNCQSVYKNYDIENCVSKKHENDNSVSKDDLPF